ncbi:hypothetical protein [Cohnella sp.]|uniref:hypothetical protein n=1 Tax=Cohnella sp. TaxID=1883426 RepID=UPI003564DCE4
MTRKTVVWISVALLVTITLVYRDKINEANHRFYALFSIYEAKNDLAFFRLLERPPSFLSLAETLEELSAVSDKEDPSEIQAIIERGKVQANAQDEHISLLIEFSDSYSSHERTEASKKLSNYTKQQEQEEIYMIHNRTEVGDVMYFVSGQYWKAKPKLISQNTKDTLASIAKELRSMEKTFATFVDYYERYYGWDDMEAAYKKQFLNQLKPHLTNFETIQNGLENYK